MSPSARKKYESRRQQRDSVSPSPSKRRPLSRQQPALDDEDDDDEDEEMLQLQLQAIETKLKLKRLQQARKAADDAETDSTGISSRPGTSGSSRRFDLPSSQSTIQVPVSPIRRRREPEEQKSPARVLGIDKGLRAQDVSLKRAATTSSRPISGHSRTSSVPTMDHRRIKSFSERIAESRNKEKEKEEKQTRIEKSRNAGFGLQSMEGLKDRPISRAASSLSFTTSTAISRSNSKLSSTTDSSRTPSTSSYISSRSFEKPAPASKYAEVSQRDESAEAPGFESFSGLHLKSRDMQHNVVTRTLEGKTIITIPQLLKTVKAPEYDPPDMENDYVIMGVIASKSAPLTPKNAVRERSSGKETDAHQTNKFMVVRLTDLKWELDLFLFDTGFSQFWKLTVGTLIAILNPEIMPPRDRATGKFSLKLTSSDDTVLEIGTARDLDFCHAMRKDGKECGQWIDGRKTEFCDFHIELQVEKSKRSRMEVNTMAGFGKGPSGNGRGGMFGGAGRGRGGKGQELKREGLWHDRYLHETMYITPGTGAAARLLDGDEQPWHVGDRAERHRKQLAEKEKERELAKKLVGMGTGAGGDYMKRKVESLQSSSRITTPADDPFLTKPEPAPSADDLLGLLNRKAEDVSLGPAKRKRTMSGKSTTASQPVGWGGAFKRGMLLSPTRKDTTSALRGAREPSPAKKKARLLLPEKGIREPGRESLGTLDVGLIAAMDDDDDDLEVV